MQSGICFEAQKMYYLPFADQKNKIGLMQNAKFLNEILTEIVYSAILKDGKMF